ncbi:hypothetical protein [Pontibacter sp. G13]|uniref:hypothetical protein n=1 Tax=Pontibacter sp. G13 TaxID=3074898 RepID=UPI002889E26B|nr:hypothetical protein [Pontibacter sp. G13]WNJ18469.1 hypothetical protein RJD25_26740 [Pontibacter sp. G13]
MKRILELGNIIYQHFPTVLEGAFRSDSKLEQLFSAIMSGEVNSDEEASQLIYEQAELGKKYFMLKRNLIRKLWSLAEDQLGSAGLVEPTHSQEEDCRRKLATSKALLNLGVYENPEKILMEVQETAEELCLSSVMIEVCQQFILQYALRKDPEQVLAWEHRLRKWNQISTDEGSARNFVLMAESRPAWHSLNAQIAQEASDHAALVKTWLDTHPTPVLEMAWICLKMYQCFNKNELGQLIPLQQRMGALVTQHPALASYTDIETWHQFAAKAFRAHGNLDEAAHHLQVCMDLSDYRFFRLFVYQETNFDLLLKQQDYAGAMQIVEDIQTVRQYKYLWIADKAAWQIRTAFLYVVMQMSGQGEWFLERFPEWESSQIIHELDQTCKSITVDRQGYQMQYQMARLLLFWLKMPEQVDNIGKNMQAFYYRHLKDLPELRTRTFFKSLSEIAIKDFDKQVILKKRRKFIEQVADYPYTFDHNELVGFERMFDLMIHPISTRS